MQVRVSGLGCRLERLDLDFSKGLSTLDQDSMHIESGSTECAFNPH